MDGSALDVALLPEHRYHNCSVLTSALCACLWGRFKSVTKKEFVAIWVIVILNAVAGVWTHYAFLIAILAGLVLATIIFAVECVFSDWRAPRQWLLAALLYLYALLWFYAVPVPGPVAVHAFLCSRVEGTGAIQSFTQSRAAMSAIPTWCGLRNKRF